MLKRLYIKGNSPYEPNKSMVAFNTFYIDRIIRSEEETASLFRAFSDEVKKREIFL